MGVVASEITSLMIIYLIVYLGADQRKHQSSVSLSFVRGIHRWSVNSPHKGPVTQKMLPFYDVIMNYDDSLPNSKIAPMKETWKGILGIVYDQNLSTICPYITIF